MYNAVTEAGFLVNDIILAIDPPNKNSHVLVNDLLSALSIGLIFVAIPEAAALGSAAAAIAPYFLKALQQAPGIAKIIWPTNTSFPAGSVERETIEIGQLYQQLGLIVRGLGPRIENTLATVQGKNNDNVSYFLALAEQGVFSKPRDEWPNLANDTRSLLTGFTTFLVSEAMVLAGWHVDVAFGVNPLALSESDAKCPFWACNCGKFLDLGCTSYDDHYQCKDNYWWYSMNKSNAYTLSKDSYDGFFHSGTHSEKDPTQLLKTIFDNGWSTGSLLLENAGDCVLQSSLRSIYTSQEQVDMLDIESEDSTARLTDPDSCNGPSISKGFYIDLISNGSLQLNHPNETLFNISSTPGKNAVNLQCTSQLNLTVLRDWPSVWYPHRHLK